MSVYEEPSERGGAGGAAGEAEPAEAEPEEAAPEAEPEKEGRRRRRRPRPPPAAAAPAPAAAAAAKGARGDGAEGEEEDGPNEPVVLVVGARDLPKMDTSLMGKGSSDPHVVVTCGRAPPAKTAVKRKNLNPAWHEQFTFHTTERGAATELVVEVYDHDKFSADDLMGVVHFTMADVRDGALGIVRAKPPPAARRPRTRRATTPTTTTTT